MKEELRILLGFFIFYLIYVILVDSTSLSNIPLVILIGIFSIYLFLPDISHEKNIFNKNKKIITILLFISSFIVYFITNLLLIPLLIIAGTLIFIYLTSNSSIHNNITTGLYLSVPLYFINPFYFLFAFLGFLSFWIASKI